jgi:hypothetical protein
MLGGAKYGEFVGLRLPSKLAGSLDAWAANQPEPQLSRSEAIWRLLSAALVASVVESVVDF